MLEFFFVTPYDTSIHQLQPKYSTHLSESCNLDGIQDRVMQTSRKAQLLTGYFTSGLSLQLVAQPLLSKVHVQDD